MTALREDQPKNRLSGPVEAIHNPHSSSLKNQNLRDKLLAKDPHSFLTCSAPPDLQVCHLIDTVHASAPKEDIEEFLSELGIIGSYRCFRLDLVANSILLSACEHINWDLYALFVCLSTEDCLLEILENLQDTNVVWKHSMMEQGSETCRPFAHSDLCYDDE